MCVKRACASGGARSGVTVPAHLASVAEDRGPHRCLHVGLDRDLDALLVLGLVHLARLVGQHVVQLDIQPIDSPRRDHVRDHTRREQRRQDEDEGLARWGQGSRNARGVVAVFVQHHAEGRLQVLDRVQLPNLDRLRVERHKGLRQHHLLLDRRAARGKLQRLMKGGTLTWLRFINEPDAVRASGP